MSADNAKASKVMRYASLEELPPAPPLSKAVKARKDTRRAARLARAINAAFDNPAPDVPADEVFARLERQFNADKRSK
jgi:hypothetical protein